MAIRRRTTSVRRTIIAGIALFCAVTSSCQKNADSPVPHGPRTRFYEVSAADYWGDYGTVLIQGYAEIHDKTNGTIEIKRTGPFIPPITFPVGPEEGELVVTDKFRKELEAAGLGRLGFRKVVKAHIVEIPWQDWDLSAEFPPGHPGLGDPDKYLDRPHSSQAAEALGDLWRVILDDGSVVEAGNKTKQARFRNKTWNGDDIFWYDTSLYSDRGGIRMIVVTAQGKQWLEERVGKWVRFREIPAN